MAMDELKESLASGTCARFRFRGENGGLRVFLAALCRRYLSLWYGGNRSGIVCGENGERSPMLC